MPDTLAISGPRPVPRPPGAIELCGRSAAVLRLQDLVRRVAPLATGLLLVAERGVDTEALARDLHRRSRPASAPFVPLDCHGDDRTSLEARLFGAEANGTGALEQLGDGSPIAAALGGTLFLDDVTELPASVQARLARLVRDGEVQCGGILVPLDLRLIATATPSIDADVRERRFRADLFRRLATSRIDVPSLAERPEDVPSLAAELLDQFCADASLPPCTLTQAALGLLGALTWPGNLAELRGVLERAARQASDHTIQIEDLLPALQLNRAPTAFEPTGTLRDARQRFERDYIASVLRHHAWRVAEAAQTLGMQRPNLYRKARQLGIPLNRLAD